MWTLVASIVACYTLLVFFYFLILNFYYLILLFFAAERLYYFKRRRGISRYQDKDNALIPGVAVLSPAHNEESTIEESILSLLNLNYPELEVIIINDGSTDRTLEVLRNKFKLFPAPRIAEEKIKTKPVKTIYKSAIDERLTIIDKESGGKADSLNTGINYSRSRLFCAVDADSIIEADALRNLVQHWLERDAKVVALGGIVRVANDCKIKNGRVLEMRLPKKFLPAIQVMEYIRAFLCGRTGWSKINTLLIISGAFGLFERKSVIESGGYRIDTVGEDMELVIRLHKKMREEKKPYRMVFVPDPVCWTQAPNSLKVLGRQRNRWHRGLIESLLYNWKMVLNPRYGLTGMFAMPYFLFFEMLGPAIEVSGYIIVIISYILGWLNIEGMLLFLLLAIVFGVLLSLFSLLLEEFTVKRYENPLDIVRLFLLAVLENFGYRQINSWWRFKAIIDVIRNKKSWGDMEKVAFT